MPIYTYQKTAEGFVCPQCQAVKQNQNTMHYHMKKHEAHLPFECPTCKKEFLHAQTLALHVAARHSKEAAKLKCPCCPHTTLTKANRIIHFMRKHCATELKGIGTTCPQCHKEYNSNTAFLYHMAGCIQLSEAKQQVLMDLSS